MTDIITDNKPSECPPNYLTQSILCTIFCFAPFGVVAIVYGSQVNQLWNLGKVDEAIRKSALANKWVSLAFWIGLGYIALMVSFYISIIIATMASL